MLYCGECATKNKWPDFYGIPLSLGPCEVCGKVRTCFDTPASWMPKKPVKNPDQQSENGRN